MSDHQHIFKYKYPSYDCELIMCDCGERLGREEVLRRLNAVEEMKTWQNGIYTGTQLRNFAVGIYEASKPLRDSA